MHSRAVLLLSLFALACLIVIGSLTLQLTSATAAPDRSGNEPRAGASSAGAASDASHLGLFRTPDAPRQGDPSRPGDSSASAELSYAEVASADTLTALLREVHRRFEPEGSSVGNGMIPYLAEMITVINQHEHLVYRIELLEPDEALAHRRAQTLDDVLRLNVIEPSNLRIVGRQGLHSAQVDVSEM